MTKSTQRKVPGVGFNYGVAYNTLSGLPTARGTAPCLTIVDVYPVSYGLSLGGHAIYLFCHCAACLSVPYTPLNFHLACSVSDFHVQDQSLGSICFYTFFDQPLHLGSLLLSIGVSFQATLRLHGNKDLEYHAVGYSIPDKLFAVVVPSYCFGSDRYVSNYNGVLY